jgi:prepilin-type processing-associated H-X9-DG protein
MAMKPAPIEDTPNGVKVSLKGLYVYPDGHANITFADGTNWPLADEYEVIQYVSGALLRPMQKRARRKANGG